MGKNSRQRRDARRRSTRPGAWTVGAATTGEAGPGQPEIIALIELASRYASVSPRAAAPKIDQLNEIGASASSPLLDPAALVVDEVLSRLGHAWEHGWQPHDLVHATRRRASAAAARWIARAILVEGDRSRALERAPQAWAEQLRSLAAAHSGADGATGLLATGGRASHAAWTAALAVLALMQQLPRSQLLVPPPSRWDHPRPAAPRAHQQATTSQQREQRAKTLTKVRALLAKAESTEFTAEAEAFTAKAQDLMTRHSIDEALLADESGESVDVQGIRVLIHHPYAMEKAGLLDVVARANRARAVWNDFASCMTLVGTPTDLAQVEMLFTSTLVQATQAMTHAGAAEGSVGADRSSGFRKAFLSAYAVRIGERLSETSRRAEASYTTDLVPVFARQAEAIDGEFERLFPHITTGTRRARFDARGWEAGRRAADDAVLPAGAVES